MPERFGPAFDVSTGDTDALRSYFAMARGADGVPALELTKWFDTNYHYLVPELTPNQQFAYTSPTTRRQFEEATALGIATRPVVLGPLTFLRLAKRTDDGPTIDLLDAVLPAYEAWLADLVQHGATALQLDEPALVLDLSDTERNGYQQAIARLRDVAGDAELTLTTYFGALGDNLDLAVSLPVDVLHVDLVRASDQLDAVADAAPATLRLSLGVVDGRNVWRTDLQALHAHLAPIVERIGATRVQLAPSCSLLHLPVDVAREESDDAELNSWLAFATQRLDEIALLTRALNDQPDAVAELADSAAAVAARAASVRVRRPDVRQRLAQVTPDWSRRTTAYPARAEAQRARLGLPALPTTTIGSFPQTAEVRSLRAAYRKGEIDQATYEAGIEAETEACIRRQEQLGVDVLVHGEFERTDMVEYFGEQLDGFATTTHGWVQSYGSRCVNHPCCSATSPARHR